MNCDCVNRINKLREVLADCRAARETLRSEVEALKHQLKKSSNPSPPVIPPNGPDRTQHGPHD